MENPNAESYFSMCKGPQASEALLHKRLALWMKQTYPGIVFRSGLEGFKLSDQDAKFASVINSHDGFPDLQVYEPRGVYCGLALELKKDGAPLYKRDGSLRKDAHLEAQQAMLAMLRARGWCAAFAQGLQAAQQQIECYMALK